MHVANQSEISPLNVKKWRQDSVDVTSRVIALLALSGIAIVAACYAAGVSSSFQAIGALGGVGALSAFAVALASRSEKNERTKSFILQAQENLSLLVKECDLDPRRFSVTWQNNYPLIEKVSLFGYLIRRLFVSKGVMLHNLKVALNLSVKAIDLSKEKNRILAEKYNRFVRTAPLFRDIAKKNRLLLFGRVSWATWGETVDRSGEFRARPFIDHNRYYYMKNQPNHSVEAAFIGAETQLKRLARLATGNCCCKYFSQNESFSDIYQRDKPVLDSGRPAVQHIGHATELFQLPHMNILTDPVFGDIGMSFKETVMLLIALTLISGVITGIGYLSGKWDLEQSGLSMVGGWVFRFALVGIIRNLYPRKTSPGLSVDELPPIDAIVISHNHRDHCDGESLKKLVYHQPLILVPKGDRAFFESLGFRHVREHSWWTTTPLSRDGTVVDFYALPSRHWSGRGCSDSQKSLTCSWAFQKRGDRGAIYFRGDTANIDAAEMAEVRRFVNAPIRANFEPAGPNYRRSLMQSTHQSVLDSLLTYFEVNENPKDQHQNRMYLMHHNAFELGTDRFNEAIFIKNQILCYLQDSSEANFKALAQFVQKEFSEGGRAFSYLDRMRRAPFLDFLEHRFLSPKIGERCLLDLN